MNKILFIFSMIVFFSLIVTTAQTIHSGTGPKIILDNYKVKVTEYSGLPGNDVCGPGKHNHPAHLTVVLDNAWVKITTTEGKTVEQKVPAGAVFWSEEEHHAVVNKGNRQVRLYIIELKK